MHLVKKNVKKEVLWGEGKIYRSKPWIYIKKGRALEKEKSEKKMIYFSYS